MITQGNQPGISTSEASQLEWLETNGLGGFASSTILGMNTRRYHSLLTVALKPPVERFVLVSKLEETLIIGDSRYDLSCNQFPGAIHPRGDLNLLSFEALPFPTSIYRVAGIEFEKRICMVHGENTVIIEYRVRSVASDKQFDLCSLEVRPLIAFRDYHSLTYRNDSLDPAVVSTPDLVTITPYKDLPSVDFAGEASAVRVTGEWYYNFEYQRELERGLDYHEDLFNPFALTFNLHEAGSLWLIVTTEHRSIVDAQRLQSNERKRRERIRGNSPVNESFTGDLTAAADQFLCRRGDLSTVLAGYHWFTDWGRDTMISLPGLSLLTGRFEEAKKILEVFAASVSEGMLPNRFPDAGENPEYNTVDATLWFFEAVHAYLRHAGDVDFVQERLFPVLKEILAWHFKGTRYGIHVNQQGLLECGSPDTQLTWMDAKIDSFVVTPRNGMPVEVQALYYNALRITEQLCLKFGEPEHQYSVAASLAQESFDRMFWNESGGYLFDVVRDDYRDDSIRPNQVLAMSLSFAIFAGDRASQALNVVEQKLLTPRGLRSLSPDHPAYRGRYQGDSASRDAAYHQGTVWPWLLGPFITGYLTVHAWSEAAVQRANQWMAEFKNHLSEAGIGQVSEIFDGDPPHTPRGCIAQAWSVAELLRVSTELARTEDQHSSE